MAVQKSSKAKAAPAAAKTKSKRGKRTHYSPADIKHDYKVRKEVAKYRAAIKNFKSKEKQSEKTRARITKYREAAGKLLKTLKTKYSWHQLKKMFGRKAGAAGPKEATAPKASPKAAPKAAAPASGAKRGRPRSTLNKGEKGDISSHRKEMGKNLAKFRSLKKGIAGAKGKKKKALQAEYDALKAAHKKHSQAIYKAAAPLRNKKKKAA